MEQTFKSIHYNVTIIIRNGYIEFFKTSDIERHNDWFNNLEDWQIDELEEYEKECSNFYWIEVSEWVNDYKTTRQEEDRSDNWHKHIKTKNWFTNEMYQWINKHTLKD